MKKIMVLVCLVLMIVGASFVYANYCDGKAGGKVDDCTSLNAGPFDGTGDDDYKDAEAACLQKCNPNIGSYGRQCKAYPRSVQTPQGFKVMLDCKNEGGDDCSGSYPCKSCNLMQSEDSFTPFGCVAAGFCTVEWLAANHAPNIVEVNDLNSVGCCDGGEDCCGFRLAAPSVPEFSTYGIIVGIIVIGGVVVWFYKKKKTPEVKQ